jgi:hypothetical protein
MATTSFAYCERSVLVFEGAVQRAAIIRRQLGICRKWNRFYEENPTATRQQLLQKATEIDAKYGAQFNPPIKPGR